MRTDEFNDVFFDSGKRIKELAIFEPILGFLRITKYSQYDLVSIAFNVLGLVLNKMFYGKGCPKSTIEDFLKEFVYEVYGDSLTEEELEDFFYTIYEGLTNNGRKHKFKYLNPATMENEIYKFDLIEKSDYGIDESFTLKLTEEGLNLMFKTREIMQELKISISQLKLRLQINKGVFDDALRTVREDLYGDIRSLYESLERMIREIEKDPLAKSMEDFNELKNRINNQLKKDREQFDELIKLVEDAKKDYDIKRDERQKEFDTLLKLYDEIKKAKNHHYKLFSGKINLGNIKDEALNKKMLTSLGTNIDIETELIDRIIENDSALGQLSKVLAPFLPVNPPKFLSVDKFFAPQNLRKNDADMGLTDIGGEEGDLFTQRFKEKQKEMESEWEDTIDKYLEYILLPLFNKKDYTLQQLFEWIKEEEGWQRVEEIAMDHRFFEVLHWLRSHQKNALFTENMLREEVVRQEFDKLYILKVFLKKLRESGRDIYKIQYIKITPPYVTSEKVSIGEDVWWHNFIIKRGERIGN
ncbi:hypothetical protein [Natranaerofaba carboxydovora]|uniref:hypothetical protein n=1 Tax=Natranaerofaba carboxydovora TaxID=2742683 RepID=UPI001F1374D4|nr:hypothetical protein [Natranaerofaba carboxydovora]UMZ74678.1 hypothetical protein ACONDI_02278 [Natranaerofaba carboxydovora]